IEVAAGEMTTLHVKPDLLAEELSRFPRVADSRIDASLPDSATVTITLREDGSRFGSGADELLIATDGTVLGPAGDRADGLPQITSGDPPEGGRLTGRSLSQALVLGGVPKELRPYVRASDFRDDGVEVTLSNGLVLIFGDGNLVDQKWKAAASVIADPEMTDASYVDLTVPRRPAVGTGDEAVGEDEAVEELDPEAVVTG
ncbi:MAG: cell division protein FtsQ/DivIB, partial [Actinomycetota bacterium]|nr:cell division protein FtsQ/DivIB [Actinomycetota bacterium]